MRNLFLFSLLTIVNVSLCMDCITFTNGTTCDCTVVKISDSKVHIIDKNNKKQKLEMKEINSIDFQVKSPKQDNTLNKNNNDTTLRKLLDNLPNQIGKKFSLSEIFIKLIEIDNDYKEMHPEVKKFIDLSDMYFIEFYCPYSRGSIFFVGGISEKENGIAFIAKKQTVKKMIEDLASVSKIPKHSGRADKCKIDFVVLEKGLAPRKKFGHVKKITFYDQNNKVTKVYSEN